MQQRKHKYVLDPALSHKKEFPRSRKRVTILSLEDVDLHTSASDKQILSRSQAIGALVLTADTGAGFNKKIVFMPNYKSTGVVLMPQDYDTEEQDEVLFRLTSAVPFEALIHTRTKVDLEKVKIAKAGTTQERIYFKEMKR